MVSCSHRVGLAVRRVEARLKKCTAIGQRFKRTRTCGDNEIHLIIAFPLKICVSRHQRIHTFIASPLKCMAFG